MGTCGAGSPASVCQRAYKSVGLFLAWVGSRLARWGRAGAKAVWRVKLVVEPEPGVAIETELARVERDPQAGLADSGFGLKRRSGSQRHCRPNWSRRGWPRRAGAVARPAGGCWRARVVTGRGSASCLAACRSGFGGGLPVRAARTKGGAELRRSRPRR